jgi:hypothetical protein
LLIIAILLKKILVEENSISNQGNHVTIKINLDLPQKHMPRMERELFAVFQWFDHEV